MAPPAPSGERGHDWRGWLEDPHFSLTPGQRYTVLVVIVLALLMLRFGLPVDTSSATTSGRPVPSVPATNPAGGR
jgi:hypothetical protein